MNLEYYGAGCALIVDKLSTLTSVDVTAPAVGVFKSPSAALASAGFVPCKLKI